MSVRPADLDWAIVPTSTEVNGHIKIEECNKITKAFNEALQKLQIISEWEELIQETKKEHMSIVTLVSNLNELATFTSEADLLMYSSTNTIERDSRWFKFVRSAGFDISVVKRTFECGKFLIERCSSLPHASRTQTVVRDLESNLRLLFTKAMSQLKDVVPKYADLESIQTYNSISIESQPPKKNFLLSIQDRANKLKKTPGNSSESSESPTSSPYNPKKVGVQMVPGITNADLRNVGLRPQVPRQTSILPTEEKPLEFQLALGRLKKTPVKKNSKEDLMPKTLSKTPVKEIPTVKASVLKKTNPTFDKVVASRKALSDAEQPTRFDVKPPSPRSRPCLNLADLFSTSPLIPRISPLSIHLENPEENEDSTWTEKFHHTPTEITKLDTMIAKTVTLKEQFESVLPKFDPKEIPKFMETLKRQKACFGEKDSGEETDSLSECYSHSFSSESESEDEDCEKICSQ